MPKAPKARRRPSASRRDSSCSHGCGGAGSPRERQPSLAKLSSVPPGPAPPHQAKQRHAPPNPPLIPNERATRPEHCQFLGRRASRPESPPTQPLGLRGLRDVSVQQRADLLFSQPARERLTSYPVTQQIRLSSHGPDVDPPLLRALAIGYAGLPGRRRPPGGRGSLGQLGAACTNGSPGSQSNLGHPGGRQHRGEWLAVSPLTG